MGGRRILLEVAVGSVDDALTAERGGADRLELNSALELGGLTPSLGCLVEVRQAVSLPIMVMIRPRAGDFVYGSRHFQVMLRDIDLALEHGADGTDNAVTQEVYGILRNALIAGLRVVREHEQRGGYVSGHSDFPEMGRFESGLPHFSQIVLGSDKAPLDYKSVFHGDQSPTKITEWVPFYQLALTIIFAHGAGAAMDTPFMNFFATGLADRSYRVIRFEFPYMASKRKTGKGKPPDREPVLRATWLRAIEMVRASGTQKLVIGGKSMGGRIASLTADEVGVDGLVCLGYPFHPVGKPDKLRVEHLAKIKTPTLIVRGERDTFGSRDEVEGYELSKAIQVKWIEDGDHSFKPRKSSGRTEEQNWEDALDEIVSFLKGIA